MSELKLFKLTLRRAALLYALRHHLFPWEPSGSLADRTGASKHGGRWIMCCGHTYSPPEIAAMVDLGWIAIKESVGRDGKPYLQTVAGPKIADAWQWPHYG